MLEESQESQQEVFGSSSSSCRDKESKISVDSHTVVHQQKEIDYLKTQI